jgi:hypothetical protein
MFIQLNYGSKLDISKGKRSQNLSLFGFIYGGNISPNPWWMLWSQFSPILGEKIDVYLKNLCYDDIFAKTSGTLFEQKNQYFREILRRKYFKNHNIGPWSRRQCLWIRKRRVGTIHRVPQIKDMYNLTRYFGNSSNAVSSTTT